jgi:hypothetical protein
MGVTNKGRNCARIFPVSMVATFLENSDLGRKRFIEEFKSISLTILQM